MRFLQNGGGDKETGMTLVKLQTKINKIHQYEGEGGD
jgi:hypothetical protein